MSGVFDPQGAGAQGLNQPRGKTHRSPDNKHPRRARVNAINAIKRSAKQWKSRLCFGSLSILKARLVIDAES